MNILLYLSIYFSIYTWFTNTDGFILQRKFFSHFLLVEDFISCTSLKIHRKIKKNLHAAIYHRAGTSSAYAQCFKTASAMENCAHSIYYWPALTLQSPGKTHHWNFFPPATLYQACTFVHCTQLNSLQDQSLMPEHNLVPGMSCQALFCVSALMQQQQSGKITNQEQTERGRRQCNVFSRL